MNTVYKKYKHKINNNITKTRIYLLNKTFRGVIRVILFLI